jgi:hypothetical protein
VKTAEKMIRRGLEEEFGEDLTDRKMIIRQQARALEVHLV